MKKSLFLIVLVLSLNMVTSCKKNLNSNNILLYNQPLDVIKFYIKGKWKMHYAQGGGSGYQRFYFQNTYIEFIFNIPNQDSVKWYNDTVIYANGSMNFYKTLHFSGPDSTYVIQFPPPASFSEWFFESYQDDTLIAVENTTEPVGYIMTKVK